MSFLQPILLIGLPLALLPVIIHLINQHRHRTVKWAAMMFLLDAKKLTKGIDRLRQFLILAMRVLAVAALIFAASRPLAGGFMAGAGGKADTILVLLDRSASMEEQNLETGESKRSSALAKITELLRKTSSRSEVVLIDSATLEPTKVTNLSSLESLPQAAPTATAANIPALLQAGVDFLATNTSGRTDIWIASDLQSEDWKADSGNWQSIRADLSGNELVRLFLLTYEQAGPNNLAISISNVNRRRSPSGYELVMDLAIKRTAASGETGEALNLPVEFTINGTRTVETLTITGDEFVRLGYTVKLGAGDERGWGRIDLPADNNPSDNQAYFVYDEPPVRKTIIVSDDQTTATTLATAASTAVDPSVSYNAATLSPADSAQIPWEETALLIWQAPIPAEDSAEAALLRQHLEKGRTLVILPPPHTSETGDAALLGNRWEAWEDRADSPASAGWWRTESGLLENTRNGSPLSVDQLRFFKTRAFSGELQPLLKLEDETVVIAKALTETEGSLYFWGTLPRTDHSTLATEGVSFFIMTHRSLAEGANSVSKARMLETGINAPLSGMQEIENSAPESNLIATGLVPGAFESDRDSGNQRLIALNRPVTEDSSETLNTDALEILLEGVEYRRISDEVGSGSSLAAEIWRAFLVAMALALLVEAILCLPPRPETESKAKPI